jgi:NADH-quinone oxidoreductase subunit G
MSTTPLVTVTIDGQTLEVPQGSMIIEAADNAAITIPRFCYHKKLSVAANCRMCLVDVANSRKPTPACATPVADGMVVFTKSPKAIGYQKAVMEFLLINHPLDCPVCDQGGECELQDLSMGYGSDVSRYQQGKIAVEDKDIGPLIETDLTRCIQCTRCVRFGTEIAGLRELGMVGRGEHSEIATFMKQAVSSELSGNVIDLCPVGALTNKPFRYQARAWEMQQHPMVSMHDCFGSHLYLHVRRGEVMRAVPRENEALNEVWLSDRDRYSVHALNAPTRATRPLLKKDGVWVEAEWLEALEHVVSTLSHLRGHQESQKIGALASPSTTVEEFYLLQKLLRSMGSHNVDFRYHMQDFSTQEDVANAPISTLNLGEINTCDVILVIGADTRAEVPLFHHRIRQAALSGSRVIVLNPVVLPSNIPGETAYALNSSALTAALVHVAQAVTKAKPLSSPFQEDLQALSATGDATVWQALATELIQAEKLLLVTGQYLTADAHFAEKVGLLAALKEATGAEMVNLTPGANAAGGYLAGCVPHRGPASKNLGETGLHAGAILAPESGLKAYLLLNVEPTLDSVYGQAAAEALAAAEIVVAFTPFVTETLKAQATVILPITALTETAGSFVNVFGDWQSWQGVATPKGEARPAWKVLRVLGNLLGLPGFDYETHEDVLKELRAHLVHMKPMATSLRIPRSLASKASGLRRLGALPMYATDMQVRAAMPLQHTPWMQDAHRVGLNAKQIKALGLEEGDFVRITQGTSQVDLPYRLMDLAADCVFIPRGLAQTAALGNAFGELTLERVAGAGEETC